MQEKTEKNQATSAESLSALMDDEAGDLELRRVLREMASDPSCQADLAARWQRYHLVQASLRHEISHKPAVNLLSGIHAGLQAEGLSVAAPHPGRFRRVMDKLGQVAVAASVAAVVLYSASQLGLNAPTNTGFDTASTDAASASEGLDGRMTANAASTGFLPELAGMYNPSELTRTVSMGEAELNRIQRAVQQFSGEAPAAVFGEVYTFPVQPENSQDQ